MLEARKYLDEITFDANNGDTCLFQQAAPDEYNKGVLDKDGRRKALQYTHHVGNNLYAYVMEFMLRTIACSIVAVNKIFGGLYKYQTKIFLGDKFKPLLKEQQILLGCYPDTRSMMVKLSPRRQEKILQFLEREKWTMTRSLATL